MQKNEKVLLWDMKIIFNFQNCKKSRAALPGETTSKNELICRTDTQAKIINIGNGYGKYL